MPAFRTATVRAVLSERPGLQRLDTDEGNAYVLTQLTGPVQTGDRVVLNTTAVDLGLGTGGWHVVHWNLAREQWAEAGPGHLMKLRYTSLQVDAGSAEEGQPDLPEELDGMPVVVCGLHSQLPCVAVALRERAPHARVAYVMTDGAALPLALSDLVASLRERDLVQGTITAGHAFGGELEAVSVPGALALARHVLRCDATIVAMGPGVVGTGSPLGTTAVEVASILDTVAALGGRPVAVLRCSSADGRDRHRGVSHHSRTALRLTRSAVLIADTGSIDPSVADGRHELIATAPPDTASLLADADLHVTTMGRGPDDDPDFFAAAGAAGRLAADLMVARR